jgi:hypothetical protein
MTTFKIFSLHPTEIGEADVFGCGIKALGILWGVVVKPAFACRFDG